MSVWIDMIRLAAVVNIGLLIGIGSVWWRNFIRYRSTYTLTLAMFAMCLLGENALSLYMYMVDEKLVAWLTSAYTPRFGLQAMMGVHVLETAGLCLLMWSTWD